MSRWAKHEGALAHISLQRSVEMLALQCAQQFPARPDHPDSSVFAELFPAPQPEPSQPNVPTAKAKQMHLNWNPLGFQKIPAKKWGDTEIAERGRSVLVMRARYRSAGLIPHQRGWTDAG